ncbi:MAG: hypothetical protein IJO00_02950 [Clostridia bacterium]|nr:hypothetical protein [Clostridia bacterium]
MKYRLFPYSKAKSEKELYFDAVAILRTLALEIKHTEPKFAKISPIHTWQHPKNTSSVSVSDISVGVISTLHPQNLSKLDKNAAVVCAELDLDTLYSASVKPLSYVEPSKFPSIDFDLSVVIPNEVRFSDAEGAWTAIDCSNISSVKVIDVYELDGTKSVTVRFTFSSDEKTLSMDEIQPIIDKIISNLNSKGILLRV